MNGYRKVESFTRVNFEKENRRQGQTMCINTKHLIKYFLTNFCGAQPSDFFYFAVGFTTQLKFTLERYQDLRFREAKNAAVRATSSANFARRRAI